MYKQLNLLFYMTNYTSLEESMMQIYTNRSAKLAVSLEPALGSSSGDLGLEQHL